MENENNYIKQAIVELAEQFCGGYINDPKHAIEKLRTYLVSQNLEKPQMSRNVVRTNTKRLSVAPRTKDTNFDPSIEEMRAELKRCKQIILTQHEKISTIPQLENELKDWEKKLAMELSKLKNKYQNEITQCNKEVKQYHKALALNSQLDEKVKGLNMELESFRRQYNKGVSSEGRLAQLQEITASRSKDILKLDSSCKKLKAKLDLKDQELKKALSRTELLERELESYRKEKVKSEEEKYENIDTNALLAKMYKKQLEEKDVEIRKLNKRVGKMHRVETQCKIKEMGFESERKEYLDRIAGLCRSSSALEKIISKSGGNFNADTGKRDGISLANYENMMELAKSATDAYNSLVIKEKQNAKSARPTTGARTTRPTTANSGKYSGWLRTTGF